MKDLNSVTIIGRLTKDAELKKITEETGVIQMSVAVTTSAKKDGQYVDEANFFNVKHFGRNLDKLTSMLVKGKQVALNGILKQERWEKDGKKNSAVVIIAQDIQMVGGSGNKSESGNAPKNNGGFQEDIPYDENDCPF